MNHYQIKNVLVSWFEELKGSPITIYNVLSFHADTITGQCWPSYDTLALESGYCRATVIEAVKKLVACGVIKKEIRTVKGRKEKTSNRYTLIKDIKPYKKSSQDQSFLSGLKNRPPSLVSRPPSPESRLEQDSSNKTQGIKEQQRESSEKLTESIKKVNDVVVGQTENRKDCTESFDEGIEKSDDSLPGKKVNQVKSQKGKKEPVANTHDLQFEGSFKPTREHLKQLNELDREKAHEVVDVLNRYITEGKVDRSVHGLLKTLITSVHNGTFTPLPKSKIKQKKTAEQIEQEKRDIEACPCCDESGFLTFENSKGTSSLCKCDHDGNHARAYADKHGLKITSLRDQTNNSPSLSRDKKAALKEGLGQMIGGFKGDKPKIPPKRILLNNEPLKEHNRKLQADAIARLKMTFDIVQEERRFVDSLKHRNHSIIIKHVISRGKQSPYFRGLFDEYIINTYVAHLKFENWLDNLPHREYEELLFSLGIIKNDS